MSRGYALVNLFFIVDIYCAFNIIKEESNQTRNWVWFGISSILGFYTMPSFLYPFVILNIFILLFNHNRIVKQIITNGAVVIAVTLLYLPVIIVNGLSALTSNKFVKPLPRNEVVHELPSFLLNSITSITGISWHYITPLLVLSFILLILKRKKEYIIIYLLFITAPFVLLTIHSVIPFSRTFNYYGFVIMLLIFFSVKDLLHNLKAVTYQYMLIFLLFIQCLLLYNFYLKVIPAEDYDITADKTSKEIIGNKKFLIDHPLFDVPLLFELNVANYKKAAIKYCNPAPISADSLYGYDYIIIDKSLDKTIIKTAKIQTLYYNVY
jgi:hypothetical protein